VELVGLACTGEGCRKFCDCDHEGTLVLFIMFVPADTQPIVPGSDTPRKLSLFCFCEDSVDVALELKLEEEDEWEGVEDGKNAE
jgi:hypothetical protein